MGFIEFSVLAEYFQFGQTMKYLILHVKMSQVGKKFKKKENVGIRLNKTQPYV